MQLVHLQEFEPATLDDIYAVHNPRFVDALEQFIKRNGKGVVEYSPTYVTENSFQDSLRVRLCSQIQGPPLKPHGNCSDCGAFLQAVGAAKALIDAVVERSATGPVSGFGICRPPGKP